jgi:hypothetical protein
MKNWNSVPRSECEEAAARGDEGAQAALAVHRALDRIEKKMQTIQLSLSSASSALRMKNCAIFHRGLR